MLTVSVVRSPLRCGGCSARAVRLFEAEHRISHSLDALARNTLTRRQQEDRGLDNS